MHFISMDAKIKYCKKLGKFHIIIFGLKAIALSLREQNNSQSYLEQIERLQRENLSLLHLNSGNFLFISQIKYNSATNLINSIYYKSIFHKNKTFHKTFLTICRARKSKWSKWSNSTFSRFHVFLWCFIFIYYGCFT